MKTDKELEQYLQDANELAKIKMKELIERLNKYSYEYYTLGDPSISDETYDSLYDELVELEQGSGIIFSNSPTQKVGNQVLPFLNKVTHKYPLLSLGKTKDDNEVMKWINNKDIVLMNKLDGLTVCLTYIDGKLTLAETRGNGEIGEDIIHNAKVFSNIPLEIPTKEETVVVGEAIIDYDTFAIINSKLPQEEQYKNPRNLVSGTVRQLDSSICRRRNVQFVAYNLLTSTKGTKVEHLNTLRDLGFTVVPYVVLNKKDYSSPNFSLNKYKDFVVEQAEYYKYPIDGLVYTYNDIAYGLSLGRTSHHPLHSLAFKFADDVETTTLLEVNWQVGRTGVITPVATFKEVELYGTTVNKATVHNLSIFKRLRLAIGDEIAVTKANQIIPRIVDNLNAKDELITERLNKIVQVPKKCPCCNEPTEQINTNNAQFLYCTNPFCKAKLIQRLSHYCSRNAMNIVGLSEKTLERFIELGILNDITDIYNLPSHRELIMSQKGFGAKAYTKLIDSIEKSKECKLANFIFALGIDNVGLSTSEDICNYFNNDIDKLRKASINELLKIKDIGDVTAESIYNFFNKDKEAIALLNSLLSYITFIENEIKNNTEVNTSNPLYGKKVYPTGKFTLKKSEIKDILNSLGSEISNGYSKTLDYLICGGDTSKSSKVNKAMKDGIPLMTEEEFLSLVNNK